MSEFEPTNEELATTIRTLYWGLAQVDSDSNEYPHIEETLLSTTAMLRERITLPTGAQLREMPYSGVCVHMEVAGKLMWTYELPPEYEGPGMVQLYELASGHSFSFPITKGEAGFYLRSLAVA